MRRLPRWVFFALALGLASLAAGCAGDSDVDLEGMEPVAVGAHTFERLRCGACHSLDGSQRAGPTLLGIYGQPVELRDGSRVVRDDAYLERSIRDTRSEVVAGYRPTMLNYRVSDVEMLGLLALMRSLADSTAPNAAP